MSPLIPVNKPSLGQREKELLLECIETEWISSEGPFVQQFEQQMAKVADRVHGVAVTSGTAALDIAVEALGVGPGDEVIMPTFTIISCINQIVRSGATPVLVDCDPLTWNMRTDQVRSKVNERTKAILLVHIYGLPVDVDPLLDVARENNLFVIEDAAQMHGQTYKGKPCGSFGDVSVFSFYPNKHVTTGEGGMLVTNDDELAERARSLRNLCFRPEARFVHEELGWNYRMTNMQAALGVAQLEQLDRFVSRKREIGRFYNGALSGIPGVQLPAERTDYAENIYWVYGLVVDPSRGFTARDAMRHLADKGIGTRPFFWPMHEQPVFRNRGLFTGEAYPVAENIARYGFYLPSGLGITDDELALVARATREVLE